MLVAHITDTHITTPGNLFYGVVDTAVCLTRAVAALNCLDPLPDLTVITGDLVDGGTPDEYAHLRSLLRPLRMPVFVIPGNHDAREPMRQAFVSDGYLPRQDFLNYVIEDHALRIVALDTLVPGKVGGALCEKRLHWFDSTLAAAPDKPTLVLMHHPPFVTGVDQMDQHGFDGRAARPAPSADRTNSLRPSSSRNRKPVRRGHRRNGSEHCSSTGARSPPRGVAELRHGAALLPAPPLV